MKKTMVALLVLVITGYSAAAQNTKARNHQTRRTENGIKSGEVTRAEAKQVRNERRDTKQAVQAARSDGRVTKAERKDIVRQKKQASATIYRAKHNNRKKG